MGAALDPRVLVAWRATVGTAWHCRLEGAARELLVGARSSGPLWACSWGHASARIRVRAHTRARTLAAVARSPLFDEYFRSELGLSVPDSAYLPQYAEDAFLTVPAGSAPDGYDLAKTNLTFAGNVGQAQSVETIVEAAGLLRNEPSIAFHVVGSGSHLDACKTRAEELGLHNLVFHGRKPVEDMPAYYAASDAMLVTFEASPMADYTLPRKVTTYLAAGRPVLAALDGETRRVLDEAKCGLCCGHGRCRGAGPHCAQICGVA